MAAFLRPDADALDGLWLNESGNNTDLFASLDESTASDTDYIQSPVDPANEVCRIRLSDPTGPVQEPFTLSYRFNNLGGAQLVVRLMQGTTQIASWTETGSGWTTQDRTLTGPQFAAITDFTNLFVELAATGATDPTPTLDLDFTAGALDSRITFAQTSLSYMVDSTGKVTTAPNNFVAGDLSFSSAWTKENIAVTSGVADPDGGTTAFTATVTGGSSHSDRRLYQGVPLYSAKWITSVWMRRRSGTGAIYLYGATYVDISSQVSSSWARVFIGFTGASYSMIALAGASDAVDIWHPQSEEVTYETTPRPFISVRYGPRFDYDPATLAPRGLLLEEQRTNVLFYSESFDQWSSLNSTVTTNVTTAPDGTTTADRITANAAAESGCRRVDVAYSGSLSNTASAYFKSAGSGFARIRNLGSEKSAYFNLSTGAVASVDAPATASIEDIGNGWYRCILIAPPSSGSLLDMGVAAAAGSSSAAGGESVYIWGAQLEAGICATSYMPTTTATVTRAVDTASITGSNFSSWYNSAAATFIVEMSSAAVTDATAHHINLHHSSDPSGIRYLLYENVIAYIQGAGGVDIGNATNNVVFKAAMALASSDTAACLNGGTVFNTGTVFPAVNQLFIGRSETSTPVKRAHFKRLTYYDIRRTNAKLQLLTA